LHLVANADQLFPHQHQEIAPLMLRWLRLYLSSFDDPPFGRPSPVTFSYRRLRTRHLPHDALSAFAFLLVFPVLLFISRKMRPQPPITLAHNLRRRSDAVLDQPLVNKIHSPSTDPPRPVVLWAPVVPSFENTHSSQIYFSVNRRRPSNCWLPLV
jgi:hypothetical protein